MSYSLEELRELGSQKIHNDTHIIKSHIESILNEDFESINKVQMFGFLSIIEKQYDLDLSSIRENARDFYNEHRLDADEQGSVFVIASKNKQSSVFYIFLIFIVFGTVAFFSLKTAPNHIVTPENKVIDEVKKNIKLEKKIEEKKIPMKEKVILHEREIEQPKERVIRKEKPVVHIQKQEVKREKIQEKKEILKEEKRKEVIVKKEKEIKNIAPTQYSLSLIPKSKVWIGYIDITKNRKYQKILKDEFSFDPKDEWLMILGHSNVIFKVNGKDLFYKNRKSLRLSYKDGVLKEVTLEEFKKINRGKKW